jgi:acetyl esterase/lipase
MRGQNHEVISLTIELHTHDGAPSTRIEQTGPLFGGATLRLSRNVNRPTLSVYLPPEDKRTGAGVIVCPGGGWHMLSIDHEGIDVAAELNDAGIAAFVLEYRLLPSPVDAAEFQAHMMTMLGDQAKLRALAEDFAPTLLADGRAALEMVRGMAEEWGVDPDRTGLLGFSAGGYLATRLALDTTDAPKPSFVASVYGAHFGAATAPADAPPLFLALADDDPLGDVVRGGSLELFRAWHDAKRPVELHVYERGSHGFGNQKQGSTSDGWVGQLVAWLSQR